MSKKLNVVLNVAERLANVVSIMGPTIRTIASEIEAMKAEVDQNNNDED